MTKGYLVMAQGEQYARQAEALARSIKKTQSCISRLSVITECEVDSSLFDRVIRIEDDLAVNSNWKIENRIKFYDLTPYDETVILDSDMLFLSDVSHWWRLFEKYNMLFTSKVMTYREEIVTENFYRRAFTFNQLPNIYSAFTYFKKSPEAKEFFKLVKSIVLNWKEWSSEYAPIHQQKNPSIDLAMSIAVKILNIENETTSTLNYPTFTHMKGRIQGWEKPTEDWHDVLLINTDKNKIKLGPFEQTGILHYVKKDFV